MSSQQSNPSPGEYERVLSEDDDSIPLNHDDMIQIVSNEKGEGKWSHITNLDEFFRRIYYFHQNNGFSCIILKEVLELLQFAFVVLFSLFLIGCVNYNILFQYDRNSTMPYLKKEHFQDAFIPIDQCVTRFSSGVTVCAVIALLFWLFRLARVVYHSTRHYEIKQFYSNALKIETKDLSNVTWYDILGHVIETQREEVLCVHQQNLNELDIYHRILRHKNYMVAMINKSVLPVRFQLPFFGNLVFLTSGYRFNLDMILFWGPGAIFENSWQLKESYKIAANRNQLANELSRRILLIGIANLLLSPIIFLWQILHSFFSYGELIKRNPSLLGARRWSNYGRLYLRHFNELDHELDARLSRGYKPATNYMNCFSSPSVVIIAKCIGFITGAILIVIICLTIYDEDVLNVQHVLSIMTVLGATVGICRSLIPDEHDIFCPERLLLDTLAQIHYVPGHWHGKSHTEQVRAEVAQLFQYKAVYILEELLSPLVTPLILIFSLRKRTLEIVDFFRQFTSEKSGVGDVCAFAMMDVKKHGNPLWMMGETTDALRSAQAENGKTELSLVHFQSANPSWKPTADGERFLSRVREHVDENMVASSLGMMPRSFATRSVFGSMGMSATMPLSSVFRGGVNKCEGPLVTSATGNTDTAQQLRPDAVSLMSRSALVIHMQHEFQAQQPNYSTFGASQMLQPPHSFDKELTSFNDLVQPSETSDDESSASFLPKQRKPPFV